MKNHMVPWPGLKARAQGSRPSSFSRPVYSGRGCAASAAAAGVCQSVTSQITTSWSPWLTGSEVNRSFIQPRLSSCSVTNRWGS